MDGRVATSGETHRRGEAAVLRVENLTVQYGALVALRDVSWSVAVRRNSRHHRTERRRQEQLFCRGDEFGHPCRTHLPRQSDVSQVRTYDLASHGLRRTFQHNSFFGELTILQNAAAAIVRDFSAGLAVSLFMPWRECGLAPRGRRRPHRSCWSSSASRRSTIDKLPGDIPYGVQRLLSVALAYGTGAKALLLDEPAAGLGGGDMKQLAEVLVDLRRRNVALVVIEHHMDLIMSIADRIVMIDQGVMLATGTPAEIQRDPRVREAYLGRDE